MISLGAKNLREGTNNLAEATATLLAMKLGKKLGASKLHLEGDSMIIV